MSKKFPPIKVEIETLPKDWAKKLLNVIVWGTEKPKFNLPINQNDNF